MRYFIPALIAIYSFHLCCANDSSDNSYDSNNADDQWEDYNEQNYVQEDDDWYFDDPYIPTDDVVVAEMKASLKAYRKEQKLINEKRNAETIRLLSAGSSALFGLILGTFCTTVSLYYAKKTALLIRYEEEGIVVDATILASEPKIRNTEQEKSQTEAIETLTNKSSDGDSEQAIHDNYSMLSDDDDTNFASFSLGPNSSSKGSSSSESAAAADDNSQQDHNNLKNMTTARLSNRNISVGRKQRKDFENVWKAADQENIRSTQRFVVVVEYKHPQFVSRIRKRLMVMGNDIKLSESKGMSKSKVLLYVLKGSPKSGQCCEEIHRALKWNMQLSFFFLLSFCIVLTTVVVVAASKLLSQNLFLAYLVVLLLIMSLEILCLDAVFANIVAKQYLDYGHDLPVVTKMKNASFENKDLEMTLKHGASFA
eukprot:scaffold743_cov145-Skeletonema_menzelii.AAC.7